MNEYSKTLSSIVINSHHRFTVRIYGGWGTGKTTLMQMLQNQLDKRQSTVTVWFDSWRYENEEFSALVPHEDYVMKLEKDKDPKLAPIKNLGDKFKKLGNSIIMNSKSSLGPVGTDLGKAIEDYRSEGFFHKNQNKISFHKHISDVVSDQLKDIRKGTNDFRIVIFIDDLDRCTPDRALEILESIKTFFDIEGIVFVIGIDPSTIDPIIKRKYGEDSRIDGMKYLQKIVQLPHTIPLWNQSRLSDTITSMMKETNLPSEVTEKVLEPKMQELIIKATELNPRDVKRFINSIVISQIYKHDIHDIEKIIAIQAFYFHGDKWLEFLKLLLPYQQRIRFLTHFILLLDKESASISNLYDLESKVLDNKDLGKNGYVYKSLPDKSILDIYKKLNDIDDNELFTLLKVSKEALLKIDRIEKYLMVADPVTTTNSVELVLGIDSRNQLELLRTKQKEEFDKYIKQEIPIHLPFAELKEFDLSGFIKSITSFHE